MNCPKFCPKDKMQYISTLTLKNTLLGQKDKKIKHSKMKMKNKLLIVEKHISFVNIRIVCPFVPNTHIRKQIYLH